MIGFLSIIALGFFLGMRHATDPDHVIAITTIVTRQRNLKRAALVGAFWGLGHTFTIFGVGAAIILFNLVIPPRIGLSMELSVGIMLIILGALNVRAFMRSVPPPAHPAENEEFEAHSHAHNGFIYAHRHTASTTLLVRMDRALARMAAYQHVRPLVIGIVHGLAGSAAVALLVLATIQNPRSAIAYLLVFGAGTIAGMMAITMSLASALNMVKGGQAVSRQLALASGVVSLAFGVFVAFQICVAGGLFNLHPHWVPK